MNKILIVTGKIKTGKTTRLMKWVSNQKNIDGILQPVVEGKRFIYHISSRTLKKLETDSNENFISIGNYKFSSSVFEWCKNILLERIDKNLDWLIIDEIGPLELNGKGLEPAFTKVIEKRNTFKGKIICVVREEIFEKFLYQYKLAKEDYDLFELPE